MKTEEASAKYVACKGLLCPFCGSSNIHADELQVDGDAAWNDVKCWNCRRWWTDRFKLVGMDNVQEPEPEES